MDIVRPSNEILIDLADVLGILLLTIYLVEQASLTETLIKAK